MGPNAIIPRVTIVGGGFTGASAAVQLVRASPVAIEITVIEPRPRVGNGLAYSTNDQDHRLNAPMEGHLVDPSDPAALQRWCKKHQIAENDRGAVASDGSLFLRRKDFGAFVSDTVRSHARSATGSKIQHLRDMATDVSPRAGAVDVRTRDGRLLTSELLVVATGNATPRLPAEFAENMSASSAVVAVPTDLERVHQVPKSARVLLIGSGLTALDVLSTMLKSGHRGAITAISRRGLRPHANRPMTTAPDLDITRALLDRVEGPVASFIREAGNPPTTLGLLRALRSQIRAVESTGDTWHTAFDELRDVVWQVWPTLPASEKKRFMKHLRSWWDVHRFRCPPQNDAMVRDAERNGRVVFRAARLHAVAEEADGRIRVVLRDRGRHSLQTAHFDAVINCTGIDAAAGAQSNPFLASLYHTGSIRADDSGFGFAVDAGCRPIGEDCSANDSIRIFGPPNAGTFGDSFGAIFIATQIRRALPNMLKTLEVSQSINQ